MIIKNVRDLHDLQEMINNLPYMYPQPATRESVYGLTSVFVPDGMKEWVGGWTGERWILVEYPYADKTSPQVIYVDMPEPKIDVSFVHFAEDEQKKLFVIQAFSPKGRPLFDLYYYGLPFPSMLRMILPEKGDIPTGGKTYIYDTMVERMEMPESEVGYFELWFILEQ